MISSSDGSTIGAASDRHVPSGHSREEGSLAPHDGVSWFPTIPWIPPRGSPMKVHAALLLPFFSLSLASAVASAAPPGNAPPVCGLARPASLFLSPPNGKLQSVSI